MGLCAVATSYAQFQNVGFELVEIHSGTYSDGVNLDGYMTFDMFIYGNDSTDQLVTVYSVDDGTPGAPDATDTKIEFTGSVFQHEMAGPFGADNNCAFWGGNPTMQYDTYFTFDDTTSCSLDNPFFGLYVIPDEATVIDSFEGPLNGDYFDGGDLWLDDGAFFRPCDDQVPVFGADLKYRVARITTNNDFSGYFKAQICCDSEVSPLDTNMVDVFCQDTIVNGMDTTIIMCLGMEFNCGFSCFGNPNSIDNSVSVLDPIPCFGETGSIELGDNSGNGATVDLINSFTNEVILSASSATVAGGLGVGCYSAVFTDENGCEGYGAACLFEPPPLVAELGDVWWLDCDQWGSAHMCANASGGTGALTYEIPGYGSSSSGCVDGLDCGFYTLIVTDENDCTASVSAEIPCFPIPGIYANPLPGSCEPCSGAVEFALNGEQIPLDAIIYFEGNEVGYVYIDDLFDTVVLDGLCPGGYDVVGYTQEGCQVLEYFEIEEPETWETVLNTTDVTCFAACDGTAQEEITGGSNLNVVYTDSNNNVVDQYALCAGTYFLTISDDNGCEEVIEFTIVEPLPLVLVVDNDFDACSASCQVQAEILIDGGTPGYSVEVLKDGAFFDNWVLVGDGDNTIIINDLCAGDYDVFVTDLIGCFTSDSFTIDESETFEMIVTSTNSTCFDSCTGTIDVEVIGDGDFDISCVDEDGFPVDMLALCAGDYVCTVESDAGCAQMENVTIEAPEGITVVITPVDPFCFEDCSGYIQLDSLSGVSADFEIFLNDVSIEDNTGAGFGFWELCAGDYDLVITDNLSGCSQTFVTQTLSNPEPFELILESQDVVCNGESSGWISVECIGGEGEIMLVDQELPCPALLSDLSTGLYFITIQDENGCQQTDSVLIEEPEPLVFTISNIMDTPCEEVCLGSFEYEASGGTFPYGYIMPGVVIPETENLCPGEYEFCAIDANACMTCELITIDITTPILLDLETENVTCTGMDNGSVVFAAFGGSGPLTYSFDPEDVDPTTMSEGEYTITVTDTVGCMTSELFSIQAENNNPFTINLVTTPETCWQTNDGTILAQTFGGEAPFEFQWDDALAQMTQLAIGLGSYEVYTVMIEDASGCVQWASSEIEPNEDCLFISNAITPNGDGANDEWLIGGLSEFPDSQVQVFNLWGQIIFDSKGYGTPWDGTYEGKPVSVADYYYIISYSPDTEPITGVVTVKY